MRQRIREGPIAKDIAMKWCLQIAIALHYLHQEHYIHRDVKPENIFIDENDNAILGDLGCLSTKSLTGTFAGDLKYMARDVVKRAYAGGPDYTTKVDVFSLGLIMAELLTGKKQDMDIGNDIEKPIPYKPGVDNALIDICSDMVIKDPSCRPPIH